MYFLRPKSTKKSRPCSASKNFSRLPPLKKLRRVHGLSSKRGQASFYSFAILLPGPLPLFLRFAWRKILSLHRNGAVVCQISF